MAARGKRCCADGKVRLDNRAWGYGANWDLEILAWALPYVGIMVAYPVRILLKGGTLELPKSLDPSPLIYPTLLPVLLALSLTPKNVEIENTYLLANLVMSLANLPPVLTGSWSLHWMLSLCPLLPSTWAPSAHVQNNTLTLLAPLNASLISALTNLLYPSLTHSELRLVSSALLNLLLHATSPQSLILRALIWGGGIAVFVLCEDLIRWNIGLARVPYNRFRNAGSAIIGISRLRYLANLKPWNRVEQASDSEAELDTFTQRRPARPRSFWASLSKRQARVRKYAYATAVYTIVLAVVLLGLRPHIAARALDGIDPFLWFPAYILCGQSWYQGLVDYLAPGYGYCVTAGSIPAANTRLLIIVIWAGILTVGITIATTLAPRIAVDTRRKIFHGMVVPMFLVPGLLDPPFTHLCLSVALGLFILVDLVRAGQLPPASAWIAQFLQPYVDGRDLKGPMVVSHVFLLIGTGIGWWLTLAGEPVVGWDWDGSTELAMVAGVACVGLGDAAASLVGRRWGTTKWGWRGGKSVEGSLAFTGAVTVGLGVARWWIVGRGGEWGGGVWGRLLGVAAWGSLVEATATGINDNVVVPLGVWAMVRGVGL